MNGTRNMSWRLLFDPELVDALLPFAAQAAQEEKEVTYEDRSYL